MPDTGPIYSLPPSYFVQNGDTLLPVQHNPVFEDIRDALTNRVTRDGAGNMTGDLDMAGNKVAGLGDAENPGDAVSLDAMQTYVQGFGLGAAADAPVVTDFHDPSLPLGFYRWNTNSDNRPHNTGGGGALKFARDGTRFGWIAMRSEGGLEPQIYAVTTDGSSPANWGPWREIYHTGNLSPVQTTGNQTIAGNKTFTGILNIQGSNPQVHLTDTDGINWAIVSNNNTDLLIGVDRDNSGTIEAPHPLLLESDNNRGLLFGNPIASVYTGSTANETNFPIGTTLLVALATSGDSLPARNSVVTIRLNPGNSAQYIWGSSATGTIVQGTWRNRGSLVQGGALLMERVA